MILVAVLFIGAPIVSWSLWLVMQPHVYLGESIAKLADPLIKNIPKNALPFVWWGVIIILLIPIFLFGITLLIGAFIACVKGYAKKCIK